MGLQYVLKELKQKKLHYFHGLLNVQWEMENLVSLSSEAIVDCL